MHFYRAIKKGNRSLCRCLFLRHFSRRFLSHESQVMSSSVDNCGSESLSSRRKYHSNLSKVDGNLHKKKVKKVYCASDMEAQLSAFLQEARVSRNEPFTHTTKIPSGRYYIGHDDIEDFWTRYCNVVRQPKITARPTMTERPGQFTPLRVDFDFKSSLDSGLYRFYTDELMEQIVQKYQEEIKAMVEEDEYEDRLVWCILLEKDAPRVEEGKVKDGFHLHFPNFICEDWIFEYLRGKVGHWMVEQKLWNMPNVEWLQEPSEFIDKNMARKMWMLYGSAKDPKASAYMWSRVYDHNLEDMDIEEVFEEQYVGRKNSPKYYLPRFMSIRGFEEAIPLKTHVEAKKNAFSTKKKRKPVLMNRQRTEQEILEDIKVIRDGGIMDMLSRRQCRRLFVLDRRWMDFVQHW